MYWNERSMLLFLKHDLSQLHSHKMFPVSFPNERVIRYWLHSYTFPIKIFYQEESPPFNLSRKYPYALPALAPIPLPELSWL